MKSIINPVGTKKIYFYAVSNEITNASTLKDAFNYYNDLEDLRIYLFRNQISDLLQFDGLYDNKPNLKTSYFEVRENAIAD